MTASGETARDRLRSAWRAAGWYPGMTIGQAVTTSARVHGDDQLIFAQVDGPTTTVSLDGLVGRAHACAGRLVSAGVRPGEHVVLWAPADAVSTEVLVALWILGGVPVPVAATVTNSEVLHVMGETGARTAVVTPRFRGRDLPTELVDGVASLSPRPVIVLGHDGVPGAVPLSSLEVSHIPAGVRPDPSDVAVVLYTSGSTAAPKGVRHSHETLLSGIMAVPVDGASRMLGTFPAGHVASLLGLLRPLAAGGTTVVMDRWSARAAAGLIEEHRISVSAGTPFFLSTLLDSAERSGRDISSLSRFLVGAAAVPPALVARSEAAGIVSWRTYGSTEHPAISAGGPGDPPEKRRLTDGRVAPGNEVRLIDQAGRDVAPGEEGEIVARGPKQFLGYQEPGADQEAFFEQTWFRTGDLARFDDDGYLVVTDRVKDVIIRGGENISARQVEEVLARHPAVEEVAVCAAPDERWGEAVCAVIVTRPGHEAPSLEGLTTLAAAAGLAAHKAPTALVLTAVLPRTSAGKVCKRDLRPLL